MYVCIQTSQTFGTAGRPVYICMYVCMYVCMYTCMRNIPAFSLAGHLTHMYVCMHVCMYVYLFVCMYTTTPGNAIRNIG